MSSSLTFFLHPPLCSFLSFSPSQCSCLSFSLLLNVLVFPSLSFSLFLSFSLLLIVPFFLSPSQCSCLSFSLLLIVPFFLYSLRPSLFLSLRLPPTGNLILVELHHFKTFLKVGGARGNVNMKPNYTSRLNCCLIKQRLCFEKTNLILWLLASLHLCVYQLN